jgi:hypothetical protein
MRRSGGVSALSSLAHCYTPRHSSLPTQALLTLHITHTTAPPADLARPPQQKRRRCWDLLNGSGWQREAAQEHAVRATQGRIIAAAAAAGELPATQSLGFLSDVFVDFQWPDDEPASPPAAAPPIAPTASPRAADANPRARTAACLCLDNSG